MKEEKIFDFGAVNGSFSADPMRGNIRAFCGSSVGSREQFADRISDELSLTEDYASGIPDSDTIRPAWNFFQKSVGGERNLQGPFRFSTSFSTEYARTIHGISRHCGIGAIELYGQDAIKKAQLFEEWGWRIACVRKDRREGKALELVVCLSFKRETPAGILMADAVNRFFENEATAPAI